MTAVTLREVIDVLETAYPPSLAESWDSVGLVAGDPDEPVNRVLLAVDATAAVVDEALDWGAQLLLVHHPLLLRGVDTVGAHTPKGALIHRLIRGGCALFTAHTNADRADPGVSDALAQALGLTGLRPIEPKPEPAVDKWVVLVPADSAEQVRAALFDAGAGRLGNYRECCWTTSGTGQFRPEAGADPAIGTVGELERVAEDRVEVVAPRSVRGRVLAALRAAHPYEEPAFDVLELAELPGSRGLGRVGDLPVPQTLREFTERVAAALPATEWGGPRCRRPRPDRPHRCGVRRLRRLLSRHRRTARRRCVRHRGSAAPSGRRAPARRRTRARRRRALGQRVPVVCAGERSARRRVRRSRRVGGPRQRATHRSLDHRRPVGPGSS